MNNLPSYQPSDDYFMREAIKQAHLAAARDEVPVGAVVVHENRIIARAYNQVELLRDPTAHAEMIAMTQAAAALQSKWLLNCVLYVTLEPCAMCAGAIVLARMARLCFGASDPKAGACGSVLNIVEHAKLNHAVATEQGPYADVCGALLSEFFQRKRQEKRENNP